MRSLRGAERDLLGRLASIDRAEVGLFEVWSRLEPELAAHGRLVLVDQRAHGHR